VKGKKNRTDVQKFQQHLMKNIIALHNDLRNKNYRHGKYQHFKISDPKPRDIHKATVRDRLVHRAIYRILYRHFDRKFVPDSYSCRDNKGTHKAVNKFRNFAGKVSQNNTKTCWVLKCDIKKFFSNIDHDILIGILEKTIEDEDIRRLLKEIIGSFNADIKNSQRRGLPLGNLTSQLLVNIYMNEFDQFVKHELRAKYYIRYADDFVFLDDNKESLLRILSAVKSFLADELSLKIHPNKIYIKTVTSGVDFLGWVNFPKHKVIRTSTKRRMLKNLRKNNYEFASAQSCLGLLGHGSTYKIRQQMGNVEPI
jgi:RNA-directed DNA polymerase